MTEIETPSPENPDAGTENTPVTPAAVDAVAGQQAAAGEIQAVGNAEQRETGEQADSQLQEQLDKLSERMNIKDRADEISGNLMKNLSQTIKEASDGNIKSTMWLQALTGLLWVTTAFGNKENPSWVEMLKADPAMRNVLEKGAGLKLIENGDTTTFEWVDPQMDLLPPFHTMEFTEQFFGSATSKQILEKIGDKKGTIAALDDEFILKLPAEKQLMVQLFREATTSVVGADKPVFEAFEKKGKGPAIRRKMLELEEKYQEDFTKMVGDKNPGNLKMLTWYEREAEKENGPKKPSDENGEETELDVPEADIKVDDKLTLTSYRAKMSYLQLQEEGLKLDDKIITKDFLKEILTGPLSLQSSPFNEIWKESLDLFYEGNFDEEKASILIEKINASLDEKEEKWTMDSLKTMHTEFQKLVGEGKDLTWRGHLETLEKGEAPQSFNLLERFKQGPLKSILEFKT